MTAAELRALAEMVEALAIKCLSIKQPYPHHIFHDGKDVENRDWRTNSRGWVIVHAGKSTDECAKSQMDFPRGGIVGMMKITDCVTQMDSKWFFGDYGFVIGEAFPLPLIPCRGQLGFFVPPLDAIAIIAASLRAIAETRHD